MKIAPLSTNDPWFSHVLTHGKAYVEVLTGVPVEATILVEQVNFVHTGADENYRPRLHLQGRLVKVEAPTVELPYAVTEIEYRADFGPLADAFYDFSSQQLAHLVAKGYFEKGFEVPDAMKGLMYVLPAQAKIVFVSPETLDEPPVVFLEVEDLNSMRVNEKISGYELAGYFPNLIAQREAERETDLEKPIGEHDMDFSTMFARTAPELDLFAGEAGHLSHEAEQTVEHQVSSEAEAAHRQTSEERLEHLYRDQVAARMIEETLLTAAPERPVESHESAGISLFDDGLLAFEMEDGFDGDLDFDDDDDDFDDDPTFEEDLERSRIEYLAQREYFAQRERENARTGLAQDTEREPMLLDGLNESDTRSDGGDTLKDRVERLQAERDTLSHQAARRAAHADSEAGVENDGAIVHERADDLELS
ncbi:MAG: hypothetical protein B5766_05290 [Candidatus Lumbricidophila eiseniae]|uniref:Uncharacterized protein n=1 Tax=Candidatus Lumbricidiphila eiseniae TaxID=1969409 RepID=A0A2A6FST0_9MICO|nr:MAG: hypothetical protein B5766_05290 [Candidatus Lumbricidophila eiseniae]